MDAKNAKDGDREHFKTVTLFEVANFCRDVAECPLPIVPYKDLASGTIVMCHENQNWTDPRILGTVNWASDEPVNLGKKHSDMEQGYLFVKPGNLASKNTKFGTLKKMKGN